MSSKIPEIYYLLGKSFEEEEDLQEIPEEMDKVSFFLIFYYSYRSRTCFSPDNSTYLGVLPSNVQFYVQ